MALLAVGVARPKWLAVLLIPAALVLGLARAAHHQQSQAPLAQASPGVELRLEGEVVDAHPGARRTLRVERSGPIGTDPAAAAGLVEFFAPGGAAPAGAHVAVMGAFEPSQPRGSPQLRSTDETFAGRIDTQQVRILNPPPHADPPWLTRLRDHIDRSVRGVLPEPHGALLSAILVGKRSSLPGDLRNDFLASGLIHVVAISGFNITLVALGVRRMAGWLIGRYSVLLAMLALPLYAALAGGEPSVVRATLMGELILLAWLLGRDTDALVALAAAALAIVLVDPSALADVGFQLSFAGTLGLVVIAPGVSEWLRTRARLPRLAAEPLAVTATASLMVTPIIAHTFERLQLAAVPANLLALAAPVWIMATGAPVAVWAAAGWPFGEVLAWATWVPLEYLIQAARLAAALPGASVPIPGFSLGHAAAVYAAIALLVVLGGRQPWRIPQVRTQRIRSLAIGLGVAAFALPPLLALIVAPRLFHDPATRLTVDFAGATPTVYARHAHASLVVAGDRLRPFVLDAALPAWDPTVDLLVMPRSDGRAAATALGLLSERPVARAAAPLLHGLGPALVSQDGARRTPVEAAGSASSGGLTVRMLDHTSGSWTVLSSADVSALVAPPGAARPPPNASADVLVLTRRSTLGPSDFDVLGRAGIRLLLIPHPTRAQVAAVAIDPDGRPGIREVVEGTVALIRAESGDLEVRRPG
ncbi:MAG: ComEC/Rec2 family competence protein [Chloroflexota bacterium]|nr:ComEC/Rec2 family competence protein [Chloroflexota bacterium]MDE2920685.1 ComEC/Rec2 family competence protein [Chloroflexota bacterium]